MIWSSCVRKVQEVLGWRTIRTGVVYRGLVSLRPLAVESQHLRVQQIQFALDSSHLHRALFVQFSRLQLRFFRSVLFTLALSLARKLLLPDSSHILVKR